MEIDLPSVTADERAELHKEVLECEHDTLVRDLEPREYFSFLRSQRILDADDCEEVRAERTRRSQCERFLDLISRRGSEGYVGLCNALLKRKVQQHLVTSLNKRMAELELSFRRRKAVVIGRERYEKERIVVAEKEVGISLDQRRDILQAMREGQPIPDYPARQPLSMSPLPTDPPLPLPSQVSSPHGQYGASAAVHVAECDHKNDQYPSVVLGRSQSSPPSSTHATGIPSDVSSVVLDSVSDHDFSSLPPLTKTPSEEQDPVFRFNQPS